ncbi:MAG: ThiF family adenylyltransferase, partial [SAR324 cluster bacterium]|nr:ThiF family adenylyltransferase [SAR324 cluster bacterium]
SGGSLAAVELAKAGVGKFILVDFDRLKAHNISRHVCGLADIGRFKTRAVRDVIRQHNPEATVECHEVDITEDDELLEHIVKASDLVLVGTDNQLSKHLINEECLAASTPAIYGGAYERAFAGEVIRVIPGVAGCYACVRQGLAKTMGAVSSQEDLDYTDDSGLVAEPGLNRGQVEVEPIPKLVGKVGPEAMDGLDPVPGESQHVQVAAEGEGEG